MKYIVFEPMTVCSRDQGVSKHVHNRSSGDERERENLD